MEAKGKIMPAGNPPDIVGKREVVASKARGRTVPKVEKSINVDALDRFVRRLVNVDTEIVHVRHAGRRAANRVFPRVVEAKIIQQRRPKYVRLLNKGVLRQNIRLIGIRQDVLRI